MEKFEKVKLTDDNWESEHEKFKSLGERISGIDKEKRNVEIVDAINNLENPDTKNLAIFLLGQHESNIRQEDKYRLVGYLTNYEKSEEQMDAIDYLDDMLDHEEDVSMEPRDTDIDSVLYAYSVGLDISKEVSDLSEKYDGRYDDETIISKATTRVLAKCILDDALYYPLTDVHGLDWYANEYFRDCYNDYLGSFKRGEKVIESMNESVEQ